MSFVVEAIDAKTTRLVVRPRAPGAPSLAGLVFGAVDVFMLEPAHFLSQRGMLRVVRDRAERGVATAILVCGTTKARILRSERRRIAVHPRLLLPWARPSLQLAFLRSGRRSLRSGSLRMTRRV